MTSSPAGAASDGSQRLDWVVLLPSTVELPVDDALVLGGDDAFGSALVSGGVAESWHRPDGPSDRAMLVVVRADCPMDIEQIARHVAPGGTLYMEVDRRRRGRHGRTPGAVGQILRRLGLRVFSTHIVAPDFERPRRYLPMEHRRALRWYLRTLFIPGSAPTRLGSRAVSLVLATPATPLVKAMAQRYIMIATSRSDEAPAVGVPLARGGERSIVLTSGYDSGSRALLLPFEPRAASPRFAVKIASSPGTAIGTIREHERLISLHAILPPYIARGVPEPVGRYTLAARTACVQSCAPGPLMNVLVGQWHRPVAESCRDLDVVVDWLSDFGCATQVELSTVASDWTSIYRHAAVVVEFPPDVVTLVADAERLARSTRLGACAVHQHYDAAPWNVHLDGTRPVLIDWETDKLRPPDCLGPPLADVLYLATYWYFLVARTRSHDAEEAALVRLFATPNTKDPAVLCARSAIDRAAGRVGVEQRAVPAALVAMWLERAVYTHRRRAALGESLGAAGSRPEAYLRALAEVSPSLFETWTNG